MKKINISKDFINQFNLKLVNKENGDMEINLDCDFIVYLNQLNSFAATNFKKNKSGQNCDDTLAVKDLLVDQLQYVDFIQRDNENNNFINRKFRTK